MTPPGTVAVPRRTVEDIIDIIDIMESTADPRPMVKTLRALLDAGAGDGWLPIESAPKDRTRILAWADVEDYPELGFKIVEWDTSIGGGHPGFWYGWNEKAQPTHWKALVRPQLGRGGEG